MVPPATSEPTLNLGIPSQTTSAHAGHDACAFGDLWISIWVPARVGRAAGWILHGDDGRSRSVFGGAQCRAGVFCQERTSLGSSCGDCFSGSGEGCGIRALPQSRIRTFLRDPAPLSDGTEASFGTDSGQWGGYSCFQWSDAGGISGAWSHQRQGRRLGALIEATWRKLRGAKNNFSPSHPSTTPPGSVRTTRFAGSSAPTPWETSTRPVAAIHPSYPP